MCVYIPSSHSFNSVSLSLSLVLARSLARSLSEGLSWKRSPPTRSLFGAALHSQHRIYIGSEQAQWLHMSHVNARVGAAAQNHDAF